MMKGSHRTLLTSSLTDSHSYFQILPALCVLIHHTDVSVSTLARQSGLCLCVLTPAQSLMFADAQHKTKCVHRNRWCFAASRFW